MPNGFPKQILLHSELLHSAYPWLIDFKFNDLRPKYLKKKNKITKITGHFSSKF